LNDVGLADSRQSSPVLPADRQETRIPDDRDPQSGSWVSLVLRDVQFWVPVAVLVAGLLILRWIS
jgi:hypothetical protein